MLGRKSFRRKKGGGGGRGPKTSQTQTHAGPTSAEQHPRAGASGSKPRGTQTSTPDLRQPRAP